MKRFAFLDTIVLAMMLVCALTAGAQETPEYGGSDIYRLFCIICHAPNGQGSPLGKTLISPEATARTDDEILAVITQGRPDKGMTAFGGSLSPREIQGVMEYIRELQGKNAARVAKRDATRGAAVPIADTRAGEALFQGKAGCIQCHSYYNQGGASGPALDKVSIRLTPEQLDEALLSPSKTITDGFAAKEIETSDGKKTRARVRKETPDTLQLLSVDGSLWTTHIKKNLKSANDAAGSLMPEDAYAKLSKDEQAAILEFVKSLK